MWHNISSAEFIVRPIGVSGGGGVSLMSSFVRFFLKTTSIAVSILIYQELLVPYRRKEMYTSEARKDIVGIYPKWEFKEAEIS